MPGLHIRDLLTWMREEGEEETRRGKIWLTSIGQIIYLGQIGARVREGKEVGDVCVLAVFPAIDLGVVLDPSVPLIRFDWLFECVPSQEQLSLYFSKRAHQQCVDA